MVTRFFVLLSMHCFRNFLIHSEYCVHRKHDSLRVKVNGINIARYKSLQKPNKKKNKRKKSTILLIIEHFHCRNPKSMIN